eukprot:CAMPEP_0194090284 /NCGR_PEP_ID=MMETSP0149-20130528/38396_1 /TAXON_ID=122233 /ORGANISM="Chaetoceros debilis, Strain MM31A-1" /LENGTH=506 /DNA_ID=CAMNT_0038774487 /DNA_START=92 /DNA_END=1612 /DNA_ORIENTATION=-
MDLLGGYGSDSDSDSDDGSSSEGQAAVGPLMPVPAATANNVHVSRSQNVKSILKNKLPPSKPSESDPPSKSSSNVMSKKSRRLLKLNAVLPPEILERLTRSTVQSGGSGSGNGGLGIGSDSSESEDDDDGDDDEIKNKTTLQKNSQNTSKITIKSTSQKQTILGQIESHSEDIGLNSFLSDLSGVIPSAKPKKKETTGHLNEEKMGFAFMTSSTSITRKKKNGNDVIDIHGGGGGVFLQEGKTPKSKRIETVVEDVTSDDNSDDEDDERDHRNIDVEPLFPSQSSKILEATARSIHVSSSIQSSSRSMASSTRIRRAGPPMPPSSLSAGLFVRNPTPGSGTGAQPLQTSAQSDPLEKLNSQSQTQETKKAQHPKRSKRELEKMLRSGNFDSIQTQKIDSFNYAQQGTGGHQHQQHLSTSHVEGGGSYGTGGGLESYAPSEGTNVTQGGAAAAGLGLSSKQKGKNQIHSLVSGAAKLEADHRRMSAMGMTKGGGKARRADAKRKYGW